MTHTGQATDALRTITRHWHDLADALATRQTPDWPPTMGLTRMREPDEDGDGRPGDVRSLPIRADVFDAMQHITQALTDLADQIAADVQRPALSAATGRGWTDDVHRQAALLAARDTADPRRWRYTGQRTAPQAAAWLTARLADEPGPFRPLHPAHRARIADIAAACATSVTRILRLARQTAPTGQHCACGGDLQIHGGDGGDPAVKCGGCGRTWKLPESAATSA